MKTFRAEPIARFAGESQAVKRPKEFAYFSYDSKHEFRLDDSSMKHYYPPLLGADLSRGFESFDKRDESEDEHLVGLLKTIKAWEEREGKKIDANLVTWRGMMTKILAVPFDSRDGFEMNATLYQDCIFIEENHQYKAASRKKDTGRPRRGPPLELMTYWGYKFETLSTLPATWAETSREFIESREDQVVSNKEQYCSVVRTGIGSTVLCLGGEVDAIWDSKPLETGAPINWVELKTSQEIRDERDMDFFNSKLMKFWIQSFLLGVPKIVVGFRSREGILTRIDEIKTESIPDTVQRSPRPKWNGNVCVNFAAEFLTWLRDTIDDDGVWRIRKHPNAGTIEVFRTEETGHGSILTDEFINWRIKLSLS